MFFFLFYTRGTSGKNYPVSPPLPSDFVVVVVVVITPPLPRDGGTARAAIQIHAVNLVEIRLGESWQPISNQS